MSGWLAARRRTSLKHRARDELLNAIFCVAPDIECPELPPTVSGQLIGALLAIVVDKYCLVLRNSKLGQECEGVGEQLALAYSLLPKVLYLTVKKRVCEATKSEQR